MAAESKGSEDLSREIVSGLLEWRQQHPNATLAELEAQVQERLATLHARLLEELALASGRTEWDISQAPLCPACQQSLIARGKQRRQVQAIGGKEITLERTYGVCPACGAGLFPRRTRELGLGAGHWTPLVEEWCVRLGAWMPFAQAAALLGDLTRVQISEASVRRKTEAAGAIWVQIQTEQVDQVEATLAEPPAGPAQLVLSGDGAMVPLCGGEWAEVKTVVVGEPKETGSERRLERLSYFSRLTDAATFGRLALAERHGRGVETAGQVAAVTDGAEWLQGFIDLHRVDAIRILDWVHAVERVQRIGEAVVGQQCQTWMEAQKQQLWEVGPGPLLAEVCGWLEGSPAIREDVAYLEKRAAQMRYPQFREQGWPIGSGSVESANKLLVQARLKGAGMHWERSHVNPMLALRTIVCNDRWNEHWTPLAQRQRQDRVHRKWSPPCSTLPSPPVTRRMLPSPARPLGACQAGAPLPASSQRRPAADHPWRRRFLPAAQNANS